jgi:ribosomal protein S20
MPKTQTAKKELRKNIRRHAQNLDRKEAVKEAVHGFRKLVATGKVDEARKALPGVMKVLDKMAKVGYIKKGHADRLKSRLAQSLAKK